MAERIAFLLPFLLFLASCSFPCSQSLKLPANNTAVLDVDGKEVQSDFGIYYNILPAIQGSIGGGLSIMQKGKPQYLCPFYAMQEIDGEDEGLPMFFHTADEAQKVVHLSSDVNILFHVATTCVEGTTWRMQRDVDPDTGRRYVEVKGGWGSPGEETIGNWFKIEKHGDGDAYKIVYCPSVCGSCSVVCGNVGVFDENGYKWLGMRVEPLLVKFKRAHVIV